MKGVMQKNKMQLFAMIFISVLFSNVSETLAQYSNWSYLATGLHIRKIAEEGNYLWSATESGLVQYNKQNGQKTVFDKSNSGLQSNLINYVYVDAQGTKWIGTRESGLYKYSGGTWTNYSTSNSQLPVDNIQTIVPDTSGALWIGTYGGGLVKFKNNQWTVYDSLNTNQQIQFIYSLAYDTYGYLWVGTAGEGLFRFDGINEWVMYGTTNNNALKSDVIKAIVVDSEGNKWIGTESGDGGGLYKFDGSMFTLYSTGGFSLNVYTIAFDATNLWVGTYGGGLARLDGTSWTVFNTSNSGLTDNAIKSLYFDAQGIKWIGTEHKGLIKYSGGTFSAINMGILPNQYVFSMAKQSDGTKWIGTKNFLTRYQNGAVESVDLNDFLINPSPGLPPNFNVWSIAFDAQGYKWIGTYDGGLVRLSPLNIPKVYNTGNSGISSNNVYAVVVDKQDVKWIGTGNGLSKFDGTLWKIYKTSNSPLPSSSISSLVIDKQNKLWIATGSGVAKFDGVNWTIYTTANGLVDNYTFSIAVDSLNNKWIGTGGGLSKFDGTTWTSYTTGNSGLPQNAVQYVQCDTAGNVWVGTGGYYAGGGITKFDGTNWTTYNSSNSGLSGNEVSSFFVDETGKKWIGTFENGVSLLNDNSSQQGTISVTSPTNGTVAVSGSLFLITWSSANVASVRIEYSIDNGLNWLSISNSISASTGSYNWQVPAIPNTQALVKVSDIANGSIFGISPVFQISASFCKNVAVNSGWNLISSPVLTTNMNLSVMFPSANSPLYGFSDGYVQSDTLAIAKGYWLRFPSTNNFSICGSQHSGSTVPLVTGWNLIAPYDNDVVAGNVTTDPANILTSPFYSYEGGYQLPNSLLSGKGYWVRSNQAGTLHFPAKIAGKSGYVTPEIQKDWITLSVSDAMNNTCNVYIAKSLSNVGMYALPPVPPVGIFDFRFIDDSRAALAGNVIQASLQGAVYPVTISVDKGVLEIKDAVNGKLFNATVKQGSPARLENSGINSLLFNSIETPKDYTLLQNYPNPFNPTTVISYSIPVNSQVSLKVFDILGNELMTLVRGRQDAGSYQTLFNAVNLASGVYIYRLQAGNYTMTKKMTVIK